MADFVGYYRVSTQKQGLSGLGLEAQQMSVKGYVESVQGRLIQAFTEVESGSVDARPELECAIAYAKKHKAVLVVAKLDRLARRISVIAKLVESGLDFVAADMPHANRLTIHIIAAVAEYEREVIGQRTKAALARAKAKGKRLGNPQVHLVAPKGVQVAKKRADEFARRIIPQIEAVRDQGITSYSRIALILNEYGVKTQRGKSWTAQGVKNVIARAAELESRHETSSAQNCESSTDE